MPKLYINNPVTAATMYRFSLPRHPPWRVVVLFSHRISVTVNCWLIEEIDYTGWDVVIPLEKQCLMYRPVSRQLGNLSHRTTTSIALCSSLKRLDIKKDHKFQKQQTSIYKLQWCQKRSPFPILISRRTSLHQLKKRRSDGFPTMIFVPSKTTEEHA